MNRPDVSPRNNARAVFEMRKPAWPKNAASNSRKDFFGSGSRVAFISRSTSQRPDHTMPDSAKPAENAAPAPVRIRTEISGPAFAHSSAAQMSSTSAVPVSALRTSSRFSVRRATRPSTSSAASFRTGKVDTNRLARFPVFAGMTEQWVILYVLRADRGHDPACYTRRRIFPRIVLRRGDVAKVEHLLYGAGDDEAD